jgi:WD40 repeat protein
MDIDDPDSTMLGRMAMQVMAEAEAPGNQPLSGPAGLAELVLPGLVLLEKLGSGGMGVVYKAQQLEPERIVAVKLPHLPGAASEVMRQFRAEVAALSSLEHPNIARVYGSRVSAGWPYLIMEFVEGVPLDVRVGKPPDLKETLRLVQQAAEAVEFMHSNGVLHGDLKPANILVNASGVKLVDFGLARRTSTGLDWTAPLGPGMAGTLHYTAPEQWRSGAGANTPRSDVYSLGAVLYRLLTGSHAHADTGTDLERLNRITTEPPRPPRSLAPGLPEDICHLLLKALHQDPTQRYASAAAFGRDISNFLENRPLLARAPSAFYRAGKHLRRNWKRWSAAAVAVAAGVYHLHAVSERTEKEVGARKAAQEANLKLNSELGRSEFVRGSRAMRQGEPELALAWLAKALRRSPDNVAAARAAAHTLLHAGMLLHAGQHELKADLAGDTYAYEPLVGRSAIRVPGSVSQYVFNTAAGLELWDAGQGKFLGFIREAAQQPGFFCFDVLGADIASAECAGTGVTLGQLSGVEVRNAVVVDCGKPVMHVQFAGPRRLVAFHPGATPHQSTAFSILELQDQGWRKRQDVSVAQPVTIPDGLAVLPEAAMLVWSLPGSGALQRLDLASGQLLEPTEALPEPPSHAYLTLLPDGVSVAACGERSQYTIHAQSGKVTGNAPIPGDFWPGSPTPQWAGPPLECRLAADGTRLIPTTDQKVRAYDGKTGTLSRPSMDTRHLTRHLFAGAAGGPEADRFIAVDYNGGLELWDWTSASMVCQRISLGGGSPMFTAGFSKGGREVWSFHGKNLHRWYVRDRFAACQECSTAVKGQWNARVVMDAAWENVLLTTPSGFAGRFQMPRGKPGIFKPLSLPQHRPPDSTPNDVPGGIGAITPDGRTTVTWEVPERLGVMPEGAAAWTISLGSAGEAVGVVRMKAEVPHLAVGGLGGTLAVWDLSGKQRLFEKKLFNHPIRILEWSRDGGLLAAVDQAGTVMLCRTDPWEVLPAGNALAALDLSAGLRRLRFHPNGELIYAAAFDDVAIHCGRITPGGVRWQDRALQTFAAPIRCLAVSGDGALLVVGLFSGESVILESATGRIVRRVFSPMAVRDAAFSADGQVLFTCSADAEAHVWDLASGEELAPRLFGRHLDSSKPMMQSLTLSPDGRTLLTTNAKGNAFFWQLFQPDGPAPDWFPQWLEALARTRIGEENQVQPLPPVPVGGLAAMISGQDAYAELARQLTADAL